METANVVALGRAAMGLGLRCIGALSLAMLNPDPGQAQMSRIGSELSCPKCSITLENVVTLVGPAFDGPATAIARDPAGLYYIVDRSDNLLKVFTRDGRFIRQIGRRGAGPGEYEMVRNILVPNDGTIHVLDGALARHSSFSQNGEFLRSTPVQIQGGAGLEAVLMPNNEIVLNINQRRSADVGFALQRIDQSGRTTLLFDESAFHWRRKWLQQRLIALGKNGNLVVARPYAFAIDIYSPDLTKKHSFTRVADWIPPREPQEPPGDGVFDKEYTPHISGIWVDAQGLLWLHMMVPSPSWKPAQPMNQGPRLNSEALGKLANRPRVETIIEVVDMQRQRVVARSRFRGPIGLSFGGGYFASDFADPSGEPGVRISRAQLKR